MKFLSDKFIHQNIRGFINKTMCVRVILHSIISRQHFTFTMVKRYHDKCYTVLICIYIYKKHVFKTLCKSAGQASDLHKVLKTCFLDVIQKQVKALK